MNRPGNSIGVFTVLNPHHGEIPDLPTTKYRYRVIATPTKRLRKTPQQNQSAALFVHRLLV
jgi:hypothetical protein